MGCSLPTGSLAKIGLLLNVGTLGSNGFSQGKGFAVLKWAAPFSLAHLYVFGVLDGKRCAPSAVGFWVLAWLAMRLRDSCPSTGSLKFSGLLV